jgi:hypothetical protein
VGNRPRTIRAFAVVRDEQARARLERIFRMAPDRELVGATDDAGAAYELIVAGDVQSAYVDVSVRGAHPLIKRLRRSWGGTVRPFAKEPGRSLKAGLPVLTLDTLAESLEMMYESHAEIPRARVPVEIQHLVLDSLYQRGPDEGFVILAYDGDVVFYGPRAARLGGLPYPPPAGLTEADVDQLVRRAHRHDVVTSDDGGIFAERFWIRVRPEDVERG